MKIFVRSQLLSVEELSMLDEESSGKNVPVTVYVNVDFIQAIEQLSDDSYKIIVTDRSYPDPEPEKEFHLVASWKDLEDKGIL